MNYIEQLKEKAIENQSIVCMGMDPVLEKIPIKATPEKTISKFFLDILEAMKSEDIKPAIAKPNIAFYEQYGFPGLRALKKLIPKYQDSGIPVILDAKRADIGKTSQSYARSIFEFWGADATTVAPYMGSDSVGPFIDWCDKGKGVYILVRTSNPGAVDLQDMRVDNMPVYMKTAEALLKWYRRGTGAVVGATYPKELEDISGVFAKSGKMIPLLIPGIGTQGGSPEEVISALKSTDNPLWLHRINSSSGINYAYLDENSDDYAGSAVKAIGKLNKQLGLKL